MDDRLKLALELAQKAGAIIKDNFGKGHAAELKGDRSPVTLIDKQINSLVAESIQTAFPEDGLLGEEESYGKGSERYQWVCDPLDGTKAFILEIPVSLFVLGLAENGHMIFSVIYDPYANKMYHAVKGGGAFCNGQQMRVSPAKIDEGYALIGSESLVYAVELKKRARGTQPVPGTAYKCMMIASGRGIGMVYASADFHDIGPASLIIEEAGGKVTGLAGEKLDYNRDITGVIVSNGVTHDDFVDVVKQQVSSANTK
jgi:myo-inositol-1(or 4)-monophosphatase